MMMSPVPDIIMLLDQVSLSVISHFYFFSSIKSIHEESSPVVVSRSIDHRHESADAVKSGTVDELNLMEM